jgi:hypothetical protein
MKNLKKFYVVIFVIVLGLLIMPQFSINIAGNEIKYPNIDFTYINSQATLGNFNKGYNLYDSKIYKANLASGTDVNNIVDVIAKRIKYSNLNDVKVFSVKEGDNYRIALQFPDYIQESEKIAQYLLANGDVAFENDPQVSQIGVDLTVADIQGEIKSQFNEQYGSILTFKFNESAATNLYLALQNTNKYFLMRVDNTYFAVLQDPNFTNTQSLDLQTSVIAIPFADLKLSPNVATYTTIVRSYFLDQPLISNLTPDTNYQTVKRDFVADRLSYIGILLLASIAIVIFMFGIRNSKEKSFKFALMLLSFITLTIFLLKMQSATLSANLLLGFIFATILSVFAINHVINAKEELVDIKLKDIRTYFLFVALSMFVIYRFNLFNVSFYDAVGAILAASISIIFLCVVNYKYILNLEFLKK